jgi:hypothetical protein
MKKQKRRPVKNTTASNNDINRNSRATRKTVVTFVAESILLLILIMSVLYTINASIVGKIIGILATICSITGITFTFLLKKIKTNKFYKNHARTIHTVVIVSMIVGILLVIVWNLSAVVSRNSSEYMSQEENFNENIKSTELTDANDAETQDSYETQDDGQDSDLQQNSDSEEQYPELWPDSVTVKDDSETSAPSDSIEILYKNVIEYENINQAISLSGTDILSKENKTFIRESVHSCLQKKAGTGRQPTNEEVNGNVEFVKLTVEAKN